MTKIRIERKTVWIGQLVGIEIYIDDVKTGTINDGETQVFEIEHGKHQVYAKFGWDRSQNIEINSVENEITVLKLTQYKYGTLVLLIAIGLQAFYILGKGTLHFESKHYLILLAILISHPLYYMIKNKSLVLTELSNKNVLQHRL